MGYVWLSSAGRCERMMAGRVVVGVHGMLEVDRRARLEGGSWNRLSDALPSLCAPAPAPAVRNPDDNINKLNEIKPQ